MFRKISGGAYSGPKDNNTMRGWKFPENSGALYKRGTYSLVPNRRPPLINFSKIFQPGHSYSNPPPAIKFLEKFQIQIYEARRSVKNRIREASSNTVLEQEDEGNIFNILENM